MASPVPNSGWLRGTVNVTSTTLNNQGGLGANKPPLSGKTPVPNNCGPGSDKGTASPVPGK